MTNQPTDAAPNGAADEESRLARLTRTVDLLRDRIRMLEDENHALATKLKEHGIEVHESSKTKLELPAPATHPLENPADGHGMEEPERELFDELCRDDNVYLLLRSETKVDVGQWLGNGAVWAVAGETELTLMAGGKKPFCEKLPYSHLYKSLYNNVTGEVVLSPAEEARVGGVKLSPVEGYQLLAQIYRSAPDDEGPSQTEDTTPGDTDA